jgi:cytochrome b subunit of formate dehydrogenase
MKKFIWILVLIICGLVIFIPFVYYLQNPELTEMQIFLKFWWMDLAAVIIGVILLLNKPMEF